MKSRSFFTPIFVLLVLFCPCQAQDLPNNPHTLHALILNPSLTFLWGRVCFKTMRRMTLLYKHRYSGFCGLVQAATLGEEATLSKKLNPSKSEGRSQFGIGLKFIVPAFSIRRWNAEDKERGTKVFVTRGLKLRILHFISLITWLCKLNVWRWCLIS